MLRIRMQWPQTGNSGSKCSFNCSHYTRTSDYPTFEGTMDTWQVYRQDHQIIACAHGMSDVLLEMVKEKVENHNAKCKTDLAYNTRFKQIFAILKKTTAGGSTLSKVEEFEKKEHNKDGALV